MKERKRKNTTREPITLEPQYQPLSSVDKNNIGKNNTNKIFYYLLNIAGPSENEENFHH